MTDAQGRLTWKAISESFGVTDVFTGSRGSVQGADPAIAITNPLRFPGQYFDPEVGTHYNYHRDYEPQTGRYIQTDPIGLAGGMAMYAYANASPIRRMDYLGLWVVSGSRVRSDQNTVICDGEGGMVAHIAPMDPLNVRCLYDCVVEHEESHIRDASSQNPLLCKGRSWGEKVQASSIQERAMTEIKASNEEISCLKAKLDNLLCENDECRQAILDRITQMEQYRESFQ